MDVGQGTEMRRQVPPNSPWGFKEWLYQVSAWTARVLLLTLVAAAPWYYGSVLWQSQQIIVWVAACVGGFTLLAVLASPHRAGHNPNLVFFLLAMLIIGFMQTAPLPDLLSKHLSAQAFLADASQTAGTNVDGVASEWEWGRTLNNTVSICSSRSRGALTVFAAAILVVWSSGKLFCSRRWAWLLVATIAVNGLAIAGVGIVQRVAWNKWTLLEFRTDTYYATFVSRSSASDCFAIGFGALLVLFGVAYRKRGKLRRQTYRITYPSTSLGGRLRNRMEDAFINLDTSTVICILGLLFLFVSSMVTYSRGGAMSTTGAVLVTLGLTLGAKGRAGQGVFLVIAMALSSAALITFFGLEEPLVTRLEDLNRIAYERQDARLSLWAYCMQALHWYWLLGSGLGSFQFALLPYHDGQPMVWCQHAENIFLEVAIEFGGLGLLVCVSAIVQIIRDLFRACLTHENNLLASGAAFSFFAVVFHSFVDFSLILPGIFLPLAAIMGAFDGRMRRSEFQERTRGKHRSTSLQRFPSLESSRWRIGMNMGVLAVCLGVQLWGGDDLRALAKAERLQDKLDALEKSASVEMVATSEVETLLGQSDELVLSHPTNAEAQLMAGRVNLLALRQNLLEELAWDNDVPYASRWQVTHPYATLALLETPTTDSRLIALKEQITSSGKTPILRQKCREHFGDALARSPMDARAAWGLYLCALGYSDDQEQSLLATLLTLLCRNNPELLYKAGLATITIAEKHSHAQRLGIQMIKLAIDNQRTLAMLGLPLFVTSLSKEQLVSILPQDIVLQAKAAKSAHALSEEGRQLADELVRVIAPKLEAAVAEDLEGWAALAWAAERSGDLPLATRLLRRTLAAGGESHHVRMQLARILWESGNKAEAAKELEAISTRYPSTRGDIDRTKAEWGISMDQLR